MTLDAWLDHLNSRNRKQTTLSTYHRIISGHLRRLTEGGFSTDPKDIDEDSIRWLASNSQYTMSVRRSAISILGHWVEWETGHNPVKDADILWNKVEPERVFIDQDILKEALEVTDARGRLILLMGAKMGLRRMEIAGARLDDIHGDRILIWGKGHGEGKPSWVFIHPEVRRALDEYMVERDKIDPKREIPEILLIKYGRNARGINPKTIGATLDCIEAKIGKRITPHSLRRLYATTLHETLGADIYDICTLMRHERIETTRIYIRHDQTRLDALTSQV